MDKFTIQVKKQAIINHHGAWVAHNIYLGQGIYTISPKPRGSTVKTAYFKQLIEDVVGDIASLRILDLGCLEGLYTIELALAGADTIGVEIRAGNVARANFAKEMLGLTNVEFIQEDVRNISKDQLGTFDVVLCLGLLYHLDTPDAQELIYTIYEMTEKLLFLDTHYTEVPSLPVPYNGREYWGDRWQEHVEHASYEAQEKRSLSSLHNIYSFRFGRDSLLRLLVDAGYTTLLELPVPFQQANRIMVAAVKGKPVTVATFPDAPRPYMYAPEGPREYDYSQIAAYNIEKGSQNHLAGLDSPARIQFIMALFNDPAAVINTPHVKEYLLKTLGEDEELFDRLVELVYEVRSLESTGQNP